MILTTKEQFEQCIKYDDCGEYVAHYKTLTLRSVFQPIFSRTGTVIGAEALVRIYTRGQSQIRPDLFFHSKKYHFIDQLNVELLSRAIHIRNFSISTYRDNHLFLNLLPEAGQFIVDSGTLSQRLSDRVQQLNLKTQQIVMEVVEQESHNELSLQNAAHHLSKIGFHIAIDDYGTHASNSDRVKLLSPDIVKFDRSLLQKYMSGDKLPLLKAIEVAKTAKAKTVIEGIETEQQFEAMRRLDLNMYQGYYLGTPEGLVTNVSLAYG